MGHATRSRVVLEHLLACGHQVKVVVSGRAFDYLRARFEDVVEIRGLTLSYADNAMDWDSSILRNVLVAPSMLWTNAKVYRDEARQFAPQLCISDFDSFSYLFARRHDLPVISIDNHQILHRCKHEREVRRGLHADYHATRAFVRAKLPRCDHYLITSFFRPKVREKFRESTTLVPPILREEILAAKPTRGEHVLVYQTSTSDRTLLETLHALPEQRFVVYGLRRDEDRGHVQLRAFSEEGFIRDLASARAVVTNGGLSLLHEAIYLGKPILSVPVRHQVEQELNARYLEKLGYGLRMKKLTAEGLWSFLQENETLTRNVHRHRQAGNQVFFAALDGLLSHFSSRSQG